MNSESKSRNDAEYEMAVHIAAAFSHIKEAKAWAGREPYNAGLLNDAEHALRRAWEQVGEENRRLVDLSAYSHSGELRHV